MKVIEPIYLDNASTTPIDEMVLATMLPYLADRYGNPSSLHVFGRTAKNAIEESRQIIANIIGSDKNEIIFTSGGTESDNLVIFGIARANKNMGKHIIVSSIEHKAILDSCHKLEKEGFRITYLPVDKKGIVSLADLKSNICSDTILISIMYANNEIGSIQPIKKISEIIKQSKVAKPIFHVDACQAVNYLPINVKKLGVDAMTISSSKIYGPKGVGCLYVNKNIKIEPIIYGGGQERGQRSGTENVASIIGFANALIISEKLKTFESKRLTKLRDYFIKQVSEKVKGSSLNGGQNNRLPNNINISIPGVEGESLLLFLDNQGVCCSTGSACTSMDLSPSHVLLSIGTPVELAHCSVRFTLGRHTKKNDLDYVLKVLPECAKKIKSMSAI